MKDLYKAIVFDGSAVQNNGVSLCNLKDVMNSSVGVPRAKYQVWCDKQNFHQLYYNLDEAVEKFMELKNL
jgi:hypothetical protein